MLRGPDAWTLAVLVGFTLLVSLEARAELIISSTPFVSPKGSYVTEQGAYHTYRIPGMIVAADGAILTFAEARRGDGSDPRKDDNAPIDLAMRRSTDNGKTWEPLVVIDSGFQANGDKVDFGDPTPVLDETTGTIHLLYGQWPDLASTTVGHGQSPDPDDGHHVLWVRSSSDHGLSWSSRAQIIYPDEPAETSDGLYWRQAEPGPGNGIQLRWQVQNSSHNGRLVIPAKRSGSTTPTGSVTVDPFVYYSDDHGATWRVGDVTLGPDANEDEVVELTNGDVLLDARQNSGSFRRRYLSTDGGLTWGPNTPDDIPITAVDGSMFRYSAVRDGQDRDRILFSGPIGPGRTNIGVWTSYDEGQSFINPVQFNQEFSAYSVVQRMGDGTLGLLVETSGDEPFNQGQSYGAISFYNFGLQHLEGATHPASMSHYDGFGNSIDAFRGGIGWGGGWSHAGVIPVAGTLEFPGYFTDGDQQHVQLRDDQMTRSLGSATLDLNQNQDYFLSLFVHRDSPDGPDMASGEWLDVRLLDGANQRFAFGAISTEAFYVRNQNVSSEVRSPADTLQTEVTYFVLAKLVAQDDLQRTNSDQLFLAWYDDPAQVPSDPALIDWQLAGPMSDNFNGTIDTLSLGGGPSAAWAVDGLRIGTTWDAVVVDTGVEPPPVLGDLNGDFLIDEADWVVFRRNMTLDTSSLTEHDRLRAGDFDANGLIGVGDYQAFVGLYDTANGANAFTAALAEVPEPNCVLLVVIGGGLWGGLQRPRSSSQLSETSSTTTVAILSGAVSGTRITI